MLTTHNREFVIPMTVQGHCQGFGIMRGRRKDIGEELGRCHLVSVGDALVHACECYWLVGLKLTFDRSEVKAFHRRLIRWTETSENCARPMASYLTKKGAEARNQ